ncbi:DUF3822 family protein [Aquirufa antheringensis]|uniref:DUF3822 family protein n=1 Tax=Aquirufa antheringensis TaxID=2516559 RepID=UPI001F8F31E2|nr:DUF3822 family protein [Pseudarcicella sp. GAP-15]
MEPTNLAETLHLRLNAENFREQLLAHPKKDSRITSVHIEIANEYFLLIPNTFDSPTFRLGFLEKALGENALVGKEIQQQAIASEDATLIFLVPSDWKDYISAHFAYAKISYTHSLASCLLNNDQQLNLLIQGKLAFASLYQGNKLQLANVFRFESAIELAFYLQSIRDAFSLNWTLYPPLLVAESEEIADASLYQIPYVQS